MGETRSWARTGSLGVMSWSFRYCFCRSLQWSHTHLGFKIRLHLKRLHYPSMPPAFVMRRWHLHLLRHYFRSDKSCPRRFFLHLFHASPCVERSCKEGHWRAGVLKQDRKSSLWWCRRGIVECWNKTNGTVQSNETSRHCEQNRKMPNFELNHTCGPMHRVESMDDGKSIYFVNQNEEGGWGSSKLPPLNWAK